MLNPLSPYLANTSITRKFYIRYIMVGEFNSNSNTSSNSLKGKSDFFDSIVTCYFIDTANNIMKIWMKLIILSKTNKTSKLYTIIIIYKYPYNLELFNHSIKSILKFIFFFYFYYLEYFYYFRFLYFFYLKKIS